MNKSVAIHHRSGSFSDHWIEYCENNQIQYKIVNCYDSDIIAKLTDCYGLMWHIRHDDARDLVFGKQLIYALNQSGFHTFPDFNTLWHFDDKIGQKYLLESISAPLVKSYVFFEKGLAENWVERSSFPKVFKLRGGSGSSNVRLVNTQKEALQIINKAFGNGISQKNYKDDIKERYWQYKQGRKNIRFVLSGIYRLFKKHEYVKLKGNEKGYVYFQDFLPNQNHDIRVIVINKKAFAIKRMVRPGDFRASGSGLLNYSIDNIDTSIIKSAIGISSKLNMQSIAMDYLLVDGYPKLIEISYGFPNRNFIEKCEGYWDANLKFYEGSFNPYGWMVDIIIKKNESVQKSVSE